jgi:hypothetical protein
MVGKPTVEAGKLTVEAGKLTVEAGNTTSQWPLNQVRDTKSGGG